MVGRLNVANLHWVMPMPASPSSNKLGPKKLTVIDRERMKVHLSLTVGLIASGPP